MATYNSPKAAWAAKNRTPVWSPYLTLADFSGAGVPDSDPGGIFTSISEPSPGVIRLTITSDATATRDGVSEGCYFYLGGEFAATALGWVPDGTRGIIATVEEVVPPTLDGMMTGVGVRDIASATHGCAGGIRWNATRTGFSSNPTTLIPTGTASNNIRNTQSQFRMAYCGDPSQPVGMVDVQTVVNTAAWGYINGTYSANWNSTTSSQWSTVTADTKLIVFAGYSALALGSTRTADFRIRAAVFPARPLLP